MPCASISVIKGHFFFIFTFTNTFDCRCLLVVMNSSAAPHAQQPLHPDPGSLFGSDSLLGQFQPLLCNPLLFGSIGVTLVGFLGYSLRYVYTTAQEAIWRYFTRTLQITNDCIEFEWVLSHINNSSKWQTNNLSLDSKIGQDSRGASFMERTFLPGQGTHYFLYKGQWVEITRFKEKHMVNGTRMRVEETETILLTAYGGTTNFWKNFLDEASQTWLREMDSGLAIYSPYLGTGIVDTMWWMDKKPRKKRSLDSVVLEEGLLQRLTHDIRDFLDSEKWYAEMGVPYRRGYLLFGPPGTGKTSFISALASHFGLKVCIASLSRAGLTDEKLSRLLNNPPELSVILLEDIDVAFKNREKHGNKEDTSTESDEEDNSCAGAVARKPNKSNQRKQDATKCNVTLSGLLNAIDGVGCCEKRILFMTTNYKERLDSALIRPGRVDYEQYFGHCTPDMIERMFKRFYPRASAEQWAEFSGKLGAHGDSPITPAQLQRHFIRNKNDADALLNSVDALFK